MTDLEPQDQEEHQDRTMDLGGLDGSSNRCLGAVLSQIAYHHRPHRVHRAEPWEFLGDLGV
jgi:hypothetical protein